MPFLGKNRQPVQSSVTNKNILFDFIPGSHKNVTLANPITTTSQGKATNYFNTVKVPTTSSSFIIICTFDGNNISGANPGIWRDGSSSSGSTFAIIEGSTRQPWLRCNGVDIIRSVGLTLPAKITTVAYLFSPGNYQIWIDGVLSASSSNTTAIPAVTFDIIGYQFDTSQVVNNINYFAILLDTKVDLASLTRNPWQLYKRTNIFNLLTNVSGGAVTGTLAKTNNNDTLSANGTTTVLGSLAKTNNNDTLSSSGTTTILGTLARTNANDTSNASGSSGSSGSSGTLNKQNANDSVNASGTTTILGIVSKQNINDSLTASGTTKILGTASIMNRNDTLTASNLVVITAGKGYKNLPVPPLFR